MAAGFTLEIRSKIAPRRLFNVCFFRSHELSPIILPEYVLGCDLIGGDGGVGTIKHFYFSQALPYSYCKELVAEMDEEQFIWVYKLLEGGDMGTKVSSAEYRMKIDAAEDGGSIFRATSKYDVLPGVDAEQFVNQDKEMSLQMLKIVEDYLLANPEFGA